MKHVDLTFRFLLGTVFILFGCSKFYAFMPTPPMTPAAANFIAAIVTTGYLWQVVGMIEILGGILVLIDKTSTTGLVLLSPIILNIILYLGFLQYSVGPAPFIMILFLISSSLFLAWQRRQYWIQLFPFIS
ncbi:DoxX family protein [Leptospira brenneri]|uniref:DoxX family protein n=2 Tax=Leptospira brenneri TaxID=2023182 RepID=A0A2M9XX55_9LEPT|nr:DoxX family protein [Leptospira brenneri]PJZ43746.1 DoxX family protein [Leptospira brenneri]TGK94036.1 DoxX family protein [Leptospira brenneri]